MKRKLIVTNTDVQIGLIYEGILLGINHVQGKRDHRKHRRLLRLIEAVSDPLPRKYTDTEVHERTSPGEDRVLLLEQKDLDDIIKLIDEVPWRGVDVTKMMDASDWLLSSDSVKE